MDVMPINKLIINMSLPIIISMLVQALYNIVDSVFVARVSEQALTAVSVAFPAQNLMIAVATGTAVGMNALVSRSLGEKNFEKANKLAENGVFLSLVSYVVFLVFALVGSRAFIASQTDKLAIIEQGTSYLKIVCGVSFGIFFEITFERLLQSTGRTFYTLFTQGTGAVINIFLDPIFIFLFKMGVKGAAWATVIGQIVAAVIALILCIKKNPEIKMSFKGFRPSGKMIGKIYAIGVPSILMVAIGSVMTYCMNKILVAYTTGKETAVTVFGAFFKLNSFICMPIFGLNNGIIPIISYNYGARKRDRMIQAGKYAVIYAEIFSLIGSALFLCIPRTLLGFFNASERMLEIGIPALRIVGISFAFAGTCIALGAVFQSLGKSIFSMIVSLIRQLVVLTPAAYFLARYGMSVGNDNLVWISYPLAEVASLAVSIICFIYLYKTVIKNVENAKTL